MILHFSIEYKQFCWQTTMNFEIQSIIIKEFHFFIICASSDNVHNFRFKCLKQFKWQKNNICYCFINMTFELIRCNSFIFSDKWFFFVDFFDKFFQCRFQLNEKNVAKHILKLIQFQNVFYQIVQKKIIFLFCIGLKKKITFRKLFNH